jgi:hypothetical protein
MIKADRAWTGVLSLDVPERLTMVAFQACHLPYIEADPVLAPFFSASERVLGDYRTADS